MRWSKLPNTTSGKPSPFTSPTAGVPTTPFWPAIGHRLDPEAHRTVRVERDDAALLTLSTSSEPAPTMISLRPLRSRSATVGLDSTAARFGRRFTCTGCGQPGSSWPLRPSTTWTVPERSAVTTSRCPSPLTSAITGDDKWVERRRLAATPAGKLRERERLPSIRCGRWTRGPERARRARKKENSDGCRQLIGRSTAVLYPRFGKESTIMGLMGAPDNLRVQRQCRTEDITRSGSDTHLSRSSGRSVRATASSVREPDAQRGHRADRGDTEAGCTRRGRLGRRRTPRPSIGDELRADICLASLAGSVAAA